MTKLYREARSGTLPAQEATRLVYLLDRIARLIEAGDFEKRLETVESQLANIEKKNGNNGF